MSSDRPMPERGETAAYPPRAATRIQFPAGSGEAADSGDPACWACLVCQECGAVISEGHRADCSHVSHPAGPLRAGS